MKVITEQKAVNTLPSPFIMSFSGWMVCLSCLLIAISASMSFSVAPMYLHSVLGLTVCTINVLDGIAEAISQLSKLVSGVLADILNRRKPTLFVGIMIAAISKPVFIMANGIALICTSKFLERISNGLMATARDSFIADAAADGKKGTALCIMMTLKTLGCVLGSFLAGMLIRYNEDYLSLLWVGVIPAIAAMLIAGFVVKENTQNEDSSISNRQKVKFSDIKLLPKSYWYVVLIGMALMLARCGDGFITLRMKDISGDLSIATMTVGYFNISSSLCCFALSFYADKFRKDYLLILSCITLVICSYFMTYGSTMFEAMIGVLFWGAQRGTSQILFSAIIADIVPRKLIGTALGLFYLITGVFCAFGTSITGNIQEAYGMDASFKYMMFGAIGTILMIALTILLQDSKRKISINNNAKAENVALSIQ